MGLIFFGLYPLVFSQFRELWIRWVSQSWTPHPAKLTERAGRTSGTFILELRYLYDWEGPRNGLFSRRYLFETSAQKIPEWEPGTDIRILVDPANPARSYFPHPLAWWSFIYALPIVTLTTGIALIAGLAGFEQRRAVTRSVFPVARWHSFRLTNQASIDFPCVQHGIDTPGDTMALDEGHPLFHVEQCMVGPSSFSVAIFSYPHGLASADAVFDRVLANLRDGDFRRRYTSAPLFSYGRPGRAFSYEPPKTAVHVYVDFDTVYLISTNWSVPGDVKRFLNSFRFDNVVYRPLRN